MWSFQNEFLLIFVIILFWLSLFRFIISNVELFRNEVLKEHKGLCFILFVLCLFPLCYCGLCSKNESKISVRISDAPVFTDIVFHSFMGEVFLILLIWQSQKNQMFHYFRSHGKPPWSRRVVDARQAGTDRKQYRPIQNCQVQRGSVRRLHLRYVLICYLTQGYEALFPFQFDSNL